MFILTINPSWKYSKKQFDPFCRRERISYYYDTAEEKLINTSLIKKKTPKKNNLKQEDASSSSSSVDLLDETENHASGNSKRVWGFGCG